MSYRKNNIILNEMLEKKYQEKQDLKKSFLYGISKAHLHEIKKKRVINES